MKIYHVIQIKFNHLVYENVHMIINYRQSDSRVRNISRSFTYKMAAKINWHRYGTIITSLSPYVFCRRKHVVSPRARITKYLTTILRSSYGNAKSHDRLTTDV